MSEVPIDVRGVKTAFGSFVVHEDLDLRVRAGEILGIVGASGSGKSVLMRAIIGLKRPAAGEVLLFGRSIWGADTEERDRLIARFGVMFQHGALFSSLPVIENIAAPLREHTDLDRAFRLDLAGFKLQLVGLKLAAAWRYPAEISGGMRKRAALARALALDPEILFLDEPTAGLDPIGAAAFDQLLRELRDLLGLTVVVVTHDLDSLYAVCDRVAVLDDKHVVALAPVAELEQNDHPWIREYFRGPRSRLQQR